MSGRRVAGSSEFIPDTKAGLIRLGDVTLPRRGLLRVFDVEGWDAEADVEYDGDRLVCRSFSIKERADGAPVTGEVLRKFRVKDLLTRALGLMARRTDKPGGLSAIGSELKRKAKDGPTDEVLRLVATWYQAIYVTGGDPTASLIAFASRPRPTINRWITAAREKGFFEEGDRRG